MRSRRENSILLAVQLDPTRWGLRPLNDKWLRCPWQSRLHFETRTTIIFRGVIAHYLRNQGDEQRWVGTALLEIEPRLRRVRGMKHLSALRAALQREMGIVKRQAAA